MATSSKAKNTLRPKPRFKKHHPPVITSDETMFNIVKAGEILGMPYDVMKKHIHQKRLKALPVVGKNNKITFVVSFSELKKLRDLLIQRYKIMNGSVYSNALTRLNSINFKKMMFTDSGSTDSDIPNPTTTTVKKKKK